MDTQERNLASVLIIIVALVALCFYWSFPMRLFGIL